MPYPLLEDVCICRVTRLNVSPEKKSSVVAEPFVMPRQVWYDAYLYVLAQFS